jgi:hypothetical protein
MTYLKIILAFTYGPCLLKPMRFGNLFYSIFMWKHAAKDLSFWVLQRNDCKVIDKDSCGITSAKLLSATVVHDSIYVHFRIIIQMRTSQLVHILSTSHKKNTMVWVRERPIPTERQPLVGEVIANFLRIEGATWSASRIPTAVFSGF